MNLLARGVWGAMEEGGGTWKQILTKSRIRWCNWLDNGYILNSICLLKKVWNDQQMMETNMLLYSFLNSGRSWKAFPSVFKLYKKEKGKIWNLPVTSIKQSVTSIKQSVRSIKQPVTSIKSSITIWKLSVTIWKYLQQI